MKAESFVYWLQGFFELRDDEPVSEGLSAKQVAAIKNHLAMVFAHDIDPKLGSKEHQKVLDKIHNQGVSSPRGDLRLTC